MWAIRPLLQLLTSARKQPEGLFTATDRRKPPTHVSLDGQRKCGGHIVDYYPAYKRKEVLLLAATRMNPQDILLSEVGQTPKDKDYMISLTCRIFPRKKSNSQ